MIWESGTLFGGIAVRKFTKIAAIVSVAGLLQLGGCSFDSFSRNVWRGFGYSIGGLPASLVTGLVSDLLGALGINIGNANT